MYNANAISAHMIGSSKTDDDSYRTTESEEEELDKLKYLAAVGVLFYLATNTRSDISFAVTVLARHSQRPTARHWQDIKHLLSYTQYLMEMSQIAVRKIASAENIADLLAKALLAPQQLHLYQCSALKFEMETKDFPNPVANEDMLNVR
ncbi:hypothetical protein AXG93_2528s1940 [Marchantia polymorpha subsp. ruderalis]|uniref:Reverse transcriptase Ty1/copia-type domain-containing protein n=1 Tax=Marchantia polymorpha subsp. ruderalis TaxID=1480154 RepID=A0A176WNY3_MARPO|nr:hypothetical protein AXG93_2528s1940 [Marchantia polymorpha subsp. ruderalis]